MKQFYIGRSRMMNNKCVLTSLLKQTLDESSQACVALQVSD